MSSKHASGAPPIPRAGIVGTRASVGHAENGLLRAPFVAGHLFPHRNALLFQPRCLRRPGQITVLTRIIRELLNFSFMASLRGKVIAISGAAGGMGGATAAVLASRGATLSLADVDIKVVDQVADELRAKFKADVFTSQVDVTKTVQVDQWIDATIKQFSKLTGAVNMAGILGKEFGIKSAHEVSDEEFDRVMAVNARGLMACQRAELRVLEDGGSIVNIASISAKVGFPKAIAYAASKSAVLALTRVAAAEAGERKIRVNAVAP